MDKEERAIRDAGIVAQRMNGFPLQYIADRHGLTRERVRQITEGLAGIGLLRDEGFLTRNELAKKIGCSEGLLVRREKSGLLNPILYSSYKLYSEDEAKKAEEVMNLPKARRVTKTCEYCGNVGDYLVSTVRPHSPHRFCSRRCYHAWRRGLSSTG